MSCIRFTTPAQRRQLAASGPAVLRSDPPVARFLSPAVTPSKIARLRRLASDANPKIRESAAASHHTPLDVYEVLSRDPEASVRACIAKNEHVPCDILSRLAHDPDELVRGWVAINHFVPDEAMQSLAADESPLVQSLVQWKASIAERHEPAEQAQHPVSV